MSEERKPLLDAEGKPVTLLGRPVYLCEELPVGGVGDIVLTDPQALVDEYNRLKRAQLRDYLLRN